MKNAGKACNNRLYRHIRTFEKIIKNYFVISPKFLYEIESGQKGFSADTLYRLAEALETNADYILYGEYRGKIDNELGRIFNTFDDDKKRLVVKIMELICEFAEE